MSEYKVGDHGLVKLSGGRIVEAIIKAIVETTDGVRLQVSFGEETALIYPWQIGQTNRRPQMNKNLGRVDCCTRHDPG
jgi:hypothetical protein